VSDARFAFWVTFRARRNVGPSLEFASPQVEYALGHSSELDRLSFQATIFAPYTRQLPMEAGLSAGMRVLDVGSGSSLSLLQAIW